MPLAADIIAPVYRFLYNRASQGHRFIDWVVYCATPMDYYVLKPVLNHLPDCIFVAKDKKTRHFLRDKRETVMRWPVYPRVIIMCRHATHRFPSPHIFKVGMRHGPYHFKAFAGTKYYNAFDLFFMTSQHEVNEAKASGITCAVNGGYPKLDPVFDGSMTESVLSGIRKKTGAVDEKPILLFTATWDRSGLSAISQWIDIIDSFSDYYHVWGTVHPWTSSKYKKRLKSNPRVFFIEDPDLLPYLYLSDVVIGDTSSLLAEACALDKPLITYHISEQKRLTHNILERIEQISIKIQSNDELADAIERCIRRPRVKAESRKEANQIFFSGLDGHAGERMALIIRQSAQSIFQ